MASADTGTRPLPAVVKRLGAVSFLNDLASEMVYPLLPAFVTARLGGGAITLGALDGIAEAVAAGVKLGAGWLADHARWRRPLIVGGYAVAAVARPVIGVASAAWQVIALRGADRLGKGIRTPPRDAVIADAVPGTMRGRAFGYHRALDHAGAVAGPLIAWVLLAAAGMTPSQVILWSVVPGVLAVGVVLWALERIPPSAVPPSTVPPPTVQPSTVRPSTLFPLIVLFAFARFPETLLLLRLQDLGVAIALVPLLWAALHVVRTGASYPGGRLADRVGPGATMIGGWIWYAATCAGLALADTAWGGCLWFLALGLVAPLTEAPERAYVASLSARRGRQFGVYHAAVGVAALPGGLVLGGVYAAWGGTVALGLSGVLVAILALFAGAGSRAPRGVNSDS